MTTIGEYDFLNIQEFPVSFSHETDDRYSVIEVKGVLSSYMPAYRGETLIFYEISSWQYSTTSASSIHVLTLKQFVDYFHNYTLIEENQPLTKVTLGTRKSDKRDFILISQTKDHYYVKALHKNEIESLCDMSYYISKDDIENIREEEIIRGLLDDRVE